MGNSIPQGQTGLFSPMLVLNIARHIPTSATTFGVAERLKTSNFGIFELFGDDLLNKLNGETKIVDFFGFVGLDTPK